MIVCFWKCTYLFTWEILSLNIKQIGYFSIKMCWVHIWQFTFLLFILLLTSFYWIILPDLIYMVSKLIDFFCIPFLCAVDDIITILYGEILLCNDIKPQFQFTLICFHQTLDRVQTYFVDTVKREIQPYSFVELICWFL